MIEPLTDVQQLKALLKACVGPDMRDRRDEATLRLMLETGIRAGEVVSLQVPDVDLKAGTAIVRRGKGGRDRMVPVGPPTARSIGRYLRLHVLTASPVHRICGWAAGSEYGVAMALGAAGVVQPSVRGPMGIALVGLGLSPYRQTEAALAQPPSAAPAGQPAVVRW